MPAVRSGRQRQAGIGLLLLVLAFALAPALQAHADLEEQIENVTAAIAKDPTNPRLYVTRAELYRMHEEFDTAFADLEVAAGIDASLAEIEYVRGKIYVDMKCPHAARAAFNRYVEQMPAAVDGYLARARLLTDQKEIGLAVADYTQAVAHAKSPLPEYYMERARLEQLPGGAGPVAALKSLDDGIAKLGPLVTLELAAKDLDIAAGRIDAALARIDLLMNAAQRQETYRELRGAILEQAGRNEEALAEYRKALADCAQAPEHAQTTPMMQALKTRLDQHIAHMTGETPAAVTPEAATPGPRKLPSTPEAPATPATPVTPGASATPAGP